jgi:enamine deaminase RidA (YjgF/YER057c/UK114 family)
MPHKHWNLLRFLAVTACLLAATVGVRAQVTRIPLPDNSSFPISEGVWVGDTYYLSGTGDRMAGKPGATTTEEQTVHALDAIKKALAAQKLTMGDVVMMHAYLAPDPATGGKCDFAGFMKGYTQYFGTKEQPNKPARSAVQVGALVFPGGLIEIEVMAARAK